MMRPSDSVPGTYSTPQQSEQVTFAPPPEVVTYRPAGIGGSKDADGNVQIALLISPFKFVEVKLTAEEWENLKTHISDITVVKKPSLVVPVLN